MAPPTELVSAEAEDAPTEKPSDALIAAMKACISPDAADERVRLPDSGIEVHLKVDLPWFAGVSEADILRAVRADASCFTLEQMQELRRYVDISVRSILPSPPSPPAPPPPRPPL